MCGRCRPGDGAAAGRLYPCRMFYQTVLRVHRAQTGLWARPVQLRMVRRGEVVSRLFVPVGVHDE